MKNFWEELQRRRVIRVTLAYAVIAWLIIQVGAILLPAFNAPEWSIKALVLILLVGLPVAIILAWIFDLTPEGIVVSDQQQTHSQLPVSSKKQYSYSKLKKFKLSDLSLSLPKLNPLVSRDDEKQLIRQRLEQTKEGHGGVILISGEPGQGKTRLGEEALAMGCAMDMLPLVGHAYEEMSAPYIVSTEILEEIIRIFPKNILPNVLGDAAPEITRLVPDLYRLFPDIPAPLELPPGQQQRYMFNAMLDMVTRLSRVKPLVFLLDDLHWSDESSVQMLEHFVLHLKNLPILFVITYRDTDHDLKPPFKRTLGRIVKYPHVVKVTLKAFSVSEIDTFLTNESGKRPPAGFSDLLHRETNGNVFFIESVYQHLSDEGKLFDNEGNWSIDVLQNKIDLPESIRIVTHQRVSNLQESTQDVLLTAAVLGYHFKITDLQAINSKSEEVYKAIEQAERANLLKVSQTGYQTTHDTRYEFVHGLARHALLSQIQLFRKQSIHFAIAQSMIMNDADNANQRSADIAYHLMNSGEHADVNTRIQWLSNAGLSSLKATAYDEALSLFNSALDLFGQNPKRAELLTARATASLNLGNIPGFSCDMLEAFEIYKNQKNAFAAASICNELSFMMVWNNQVEEAIALIETGLELVGEEPSPARCQLLSSMGSAYGTSDIPLAASEFHEQAIAMAKHLGDKNLLADAYQNKGLMFWATFKGKQIANTAALGSKLHRELGQDWKLAQCLWMQEAGLNFQGKFEAAQAIANQLQPIAKKQENYGPLLCSELFTAIRYQAKGDFNTAIKQADLSIRHCEMANFPWASAMIGVRSVMKLSHGDLVGGREDVEAANTNILPSGMWAGTDVSFWLAGKAFLGDQDILQAYEQVKQRLPVKGGSKTGGQICLVQGSIEALMTIAKYEEAAKLYPVIKEVIDEKEAILGFSFGLFERYAGMAASAAKEWNLAESHFERALEQANSTPFYTEIPRIKYWHAQMLKLRNHSDDQTKANVLIDEAKTRSEALNMHGFVGFINKNS